MFRKSITALIGLLVCAHALGAFEVQVTIKKVDAEKNEIVLTGGGGQDHTVKVAKDAKFLDMAGKELKDGLKSKELKEGAAATATVEKEEGGPVLQRLQLGKKGAAPNPKRDPPPQVDLAKLKPLTDMGKEEYQGYKGGLYPDGKNERPADHEAAGLELAKKVQPLDASPARTARSCSYRWA
jgi:hypothetical protein